MRSYGAFRRRLGRSLSLPDGPTPPDGSTPRILADEGFNAALKVIQAKRGRLEEGRDEMDEGTGEDQDENMGDETSHQLSLDEALEILVRNAIEEFGPIPRDVYDGVFDLPTTKREHTNAAMNLSYSGLKSFVQTPPENLDLHPSSKCVVVAYPCKTFLRYDVWEIDFKSAWVAREVMKWMGSRETEQLEMYNLLRRIRNGPLMTEWLFELIAHRMLSRVSMAQAIPMVSDHKCPPVFSTPEGLPSTSSHPSPSTSSPAPSHARIVTPVDLTHNLSSLTLHRNMYYTPTVAHNPLFDSFTIDPDQRPVAISVFRIATPSKHGGSAEGYDLICEIGAHVRKIFESAALKVETKITYYLACPEDGQYEWRMPTGWGESPRHRGEVFCIRVPHSELCLFTEPWLNTDFN